LTPTQLAIGHINAQIAHLILNPLFQAINDILPRLAKKKMDDIIAEAQDAQFRLDFVPTVTREYVNSLNFLEEIQKRVRIKREP